MNKLEIIKILDKKGIITTSELNNLGFNSHLITKLINEGFITRKERGIYSYGSIDSLLEYGNELFETKDIDNAKYVFDICYKLEPYNYNVNAQLLYMGLLLKKSFDVFKYFDFVFNYLKKNNRENDAFYYLFLYGYCYDIPDRYIEQYRKFLKKDINSEENMNDDIRSNVYNIEFVRAKNIVTAGKSSFDDLYDQRLEKCFIGRAYNFFHFKQNNFNDNIKYGNYDRVINYLDERKKNGFISYSQKHLLYILKVFLDININGKIPVKKDVSDENNLFLCIECNQFSLAKKIIDEFFENNPEEKKENNGFYIALSRLVELIDSIELDNEKKEKLNLDNIISMIIEDDYSLVHDYLISIEKADYCFLIDGLIKLSDLIGNKYVVISTLISIATDTYKFDLNNFVALYMSALENKKYDRARILLDIISDSSYITNMSISNSMNELYNLTVSCANNKKIDYTDNSDITDINDSTIEAVYDENDSEDIPDKKKGSFENKIRKMLDSLNENNPICLLPCVSCEEEMDIIFDIIDDEYPSIKAFVINTSDGSQTVARYKIQTDEYIDFKGLYANAKHNYVRHNYEEALNLYRKLLIVGNPHVGIYGEYGLCLRNLGKRDKAVEALKIATGYSKLTNGRLDYTNVIFDLTHPLYNDPGFEKKPFVDVSNYNPDDVTFGKDMTFINDLIGLVKEGEFAFDDAIEKLGLSEEDKNYARLIYARDCYYVGSLSMGDNYLNMVEKSQYKSEDINKLIDEVRRNKKFYQNRLDEERKQLVLIK